MQKHLKDLLDSLPGEPAEGIYRAHSVSNSAQEEEIRMRETVADYTHTDVLAEISRHHSIPVMDGEVDRFLERVPANGIILDIGGCWGWHWRRIGLQRPDINVVIVDFIHGNLLRAQAMLGPLVGDQVALLLADATLLPFTINDQFKGFDAVWTVQTFQHIPSFSQAVQEAFRVLTPGGWFANYSLHPTPLNRFIYGIFGKKYHLEGRVPGSFYLAKASAAQKMVVEKIFGKKVTSRYTETLFQPDFGWVAAGKPGALLGKIDKALSSVPLLAYLLARQQSFEVQK